MTLPFSGRKGAERKRTQHAAPRGPCGPLCRTGSPANRGSPSMRPGDPLRTGFMIPPAVFRAFSARSSTRLRRRIRGRCPYHAKGELVGRRSRRAHGTARTVRCSSSFTPMATTTVFDQTWPPSRTSSWSASSHTRWIALWIRYLFTTPPTCPVSCRFGSPRASPCPRTTAPRPGLPRRRYTAPRQSSRRLARGGGA